MFRPASCVCSSSARQHGSRGVERDRIGRATSRLGKRRAAVHRQREAWRRGRLERAEADPAAIDDQLSLAVAKL